MPLETATATDQQTEGTEEQSTADQAGAEGSGVEEQGAAGDSTDGADEEGAIELLGQEKFDKLKSDPAALMKELNGAATRKFQQLAKERKELAPYSSFIKALDKDPTRAIIAVAKQFGLTVSGETATEKKTAETVDTLAEKIVSSFRKDLGPEYEDISDRLGMAVHSALQLAIPELTKSTRDQIQEVIEDSAARQAQMALEKFAETHPDWKDHEEAMTELSQRMPPGEGMNEAEYLENLYFLVTREQATGKGIKKIINRINKSAKSAGNGETTVSSKNVSNTPTKPPTFKEAAEAARRGERWE